jgi:DNA mismatch repair protein MutS2
LLREATPGALVLLDEPVTSTDPAEGAALAEALLVRLALRGFTVVATTHYNSLKALANAHPGFANASVEFNVTTLSPTYRLILGMPGGSSAIEIAGRLGMDETILEEAGRLVEKNDRDLERLLEDLQETRRKLNDDTRRVADLRAEAEAAARMQKELADRQAESEREIRKTIRKKITEEVLRAKAEVQVVLDELKQDKRLVKAREAKERLETIRDMTQARLGSLRDSRPLEELKIGDPVEVVNLETTGVLLEAPTGKKRVRVRMGEKEMSVAVTNLVGITREHDEGSPRTSRGKTSIGGYGGTSSIGRETSSVLDVRGKAADEALEALVACLDQATLAVVPFVQIIHGHGTGRLKQVLRDHLKSSPYVASFRSGDRAEGGDGVTVVSLK